MHTRRRRHKSLPLQETKWPDLGKFAASDLHFLRIYCAGGIRHLQNYLRLFACHIYTGSPGEIDCNSKQKKSETGKIDV